MRPHPASVQLGSAPFRFTWTLETDHARLASADHEIWQGPLLPLFWLQESPHAALRCVVATVDLAASSASGSGGTLALALDAIGTAQLAYQISDDQNGLRFTALTVAWAADRPAPALHSLYFGAALMSAEQRRCAPTLDEPFWPGWRAEGYGLAGAKANPMQSFFRSWDFGHANIVLGSFAPAMGTPYGAAFPRPTYAGCMGGRHGWLCLGAGGVPDAALTWQVRARSGAIEWRYREDLWGAPTAHQRTWENPLWLTWAPTAWAAYRDYFRAFPTRPAKPAHHQKTFFGTWGNFRESRFDLRPLIDSAVDTFGADLICVDDPWEATKGSCLPAPERLPNFAADIAHAHDRGIGVGIWMPLAWIEDPVAFGLTDDDLLLNRDGRPVQSNWAIDPHDANRYACLDPSSTRAVEFLRERTRRVIRDYRPTLLKIDFGYGVPGPDACAPRDPKLRGENLAWTLARIVTETAHELDRTITVLGYSIHPTWDAVQDQCSLDDLGDAGAHEATGHGNWSIWAALVADRGMPLMGSSGYLWSADADVLLNGALLGAPGANLPATEDPATTAAIARRVALFRWHRRTAGWSPLWLNSTPGNLETEPTLRCCGRLETISDTPTLTVLSLREPIDLSAICPSGQRLEWSGRWLVIAQGPHSIFAPGCIALIAFDPGHLSLPVAGPPRDVTAVIDGQPRPYRDWHYVDGHLRLTVTPTLAAQPLQGFLVNTSP